ncbi:hypothetical protein ACWGLF_28990 [Streptomyces puniciscabiei]
MPTAGRSRRPSSGTTGTTYTYDKVGNLKTAAGSGSTTTHSYDVGDELTSTTNGTTTTGYTYDADGNQTKDDDGTYAHDAANWPAPLPDRDQRMDRGCAPGGLRMFWSSCPNR